MKLVDYYDFTRLSEEDFNILKMVKQIQQYGLKQTASDVLNNIFNIINNHAFEQQEQGKLKPFIIYKEMVYRP